MGFDKNTVESFKIENGNLTQFNEGNYHILGEKGIVTTAWASAKAIHNNTIFTLIVKVKKPVSLKDLVSLNAGYSDNLAFNTEGVSKS